MHLVSVGLSHHIAPIAVRERVNCTEAQLPLALLAVARRHGIREAAILSTCNRMEVYAVCEAADVAPAYEQVAQHLAEHHRISRSELSPYLTMRSDRDAALHLMRVGAGLDSLVLGEAQILGQVKGALRAAQAAGTLGSTLTALFQQAINAGRRTQVETGLGRGAFSIGHAAVDLAGKVFAELSHASVLILGAGKMSEVTARHLRERGVASVLVANRTHARAEVLAAKLGGRAIQYDLFPDELRRADIVIASTAAPHPIITRATLAPVLRKRRGSPLILIDIAVPRDIDAEVGTMDNVYLYNIDHLQAVVANEAQGRQSEAGRAEAILEEECSRFMAWYRTREAAPVISLLRQRLETIREEELTLLFAQLPGLTERERQKIDAAMKSMATKVAREPILRMKRETAEASARPDGGERYDLLTAARQLFDLNEDESESMPPHASEASDGASAFPAPPGFPESLLVPREAER